jgi:hypothetical protein
VIQSVAREPVLVSTTPVHSDPRRARERVKFKLRDLEAEWLGTCAHIGDSVVLASVSLPVRALVSIDVYVGDRKPDSHESKRCNTCELCRALAK